MSVNALLPGALLALALAAHAPALPLPAWPVLALALASRWPKPARWLTVARLGLLASTIALAGLSWGWLDSVTLRFALLLVLALKYAEARAPGEFNLVSAAALVAVATGMLQWSEGVALALAASALWLLTAAYAMPEAARRAHLAQSLREGGKRLAWALPLAGVLFLFFPRIPGPLWDIGLSFGLPLPVTLEKSDRGLGISTRLKPGQTQTGASDGQPVLVAEFDGWVPPTSQLYWRGPVFYDFDGESWSMDAEYAGEGRKLIARGWRSAARFSEQFDGKAQEVRYRVRLTPHGGLWLYGLDVPSRLASESFIGPDWQVLAHRPVTQETSYELSSWLEWSARPEPDEALRQRALALGGDHNPRLRALGRELAQAGSGEAVTRAMTALAQGGYRVKTRFAAPDGKNALDSIWFDQKEGNAEMYAAAFTVLMRAAGMPARLVTGYRGGKLMALTDFVVVKRGHAHAWVEVLDAAKGWRRIDPTDIIAPQDAGSGKPAQKPQAAPQHAPQTAPPAAQQSDAMPQNAAPATQASAATPRAGDAVGALSDWLNRWVFKLDGEKQLALLDGKGGGLAWLWLLLAALLGSALLLAAWRLLAHWRESTRLPAPERHWRRACRLLARKGWARASNECPSQFARRVAEARPEWAQAVTGLCQHYGAWRYGREKKGSAGAVKIAARNLANRILAG